MLKTRIIPCLDVHAGRVVKGVQFVDLIDAGDPVEAAKAYSAAGADELCFLDITATSDERGIIYDIIHAVAGQCFMPLTVGGGVRTLEDIRKLLQSGADKVSINSAAVARPEFVKEAAEKFGSQCIVVAIDAKAVDGGQCTVDEGKNESSTVHCPPPTRYELFTHGGRKPTGIDAVAWAEKMEEYGAGEILLTSMARDGTKKGVDTGLTKAVADAVNIPVIASGGIGELRHFAEAVEQGHASAVLAASVFHFGIFTIAQVKEAMQGAGIGVRL